MQPMVRAVLCAIAISLALPCLAQSGDQKKAPQAPRPVQSSSAEILRLYNSIGKRLVDMAEDFPEDKYSFKAQKDQRSFGENLLHVVEEDYRLFSAVKGSPMGPAGGGDIKPENYKTKADIVKLIKQDLADGAALLQEQGDAGLMKEVKYPYANAMVHAQFIWMDVAEHRGEHYGQLVVYYRLNNLVPPASRPRQQ
jgi:uncharacterized damage-inducible protein DinB